MEESRYFRKGDEAMVRNSPPQTNTEWKFYFCFKGSRQKKWIILMLKVAKIPRVGGLFDPFFCKELHLILTQQLGKPVGSASLSMWADLTVVYCHTFRPSTHGYLEHYTAILEVQQTTQDYLVPLLLTNAYSSQVSTTELVVLHNGVIPHAPLS